MEMIISVWAGMVPFIRLYSVFEGTKVLWLWLGSAAASLFWIGLIVRGAQIPFKKTDLPFLLWVCALFIASLAGVHPVDSLIGGSYRHQGVLFFVSLYIFQLTLRTMSAAKLSIVNSVLAYGVLLQSLLVIVERFLRWDIRPVGTIGEPNAVAGYLCIGLYWVWLQYRSQVHYFAASTLVFVAVAATESRIGILLAGVWIIVTMARDKRVHRVLKGVIIIAVTVVSISVGIHRFIQTRSFDQANGPTLYEDRFLFWDMAREAVIERPWLGYGAESGEAVYERQFMKRNIKLGNFMVDRSHNIFIDVLMWSGAVGFVFFSAWFFSIVRDLQRRKAVMQLQTLGVWVLFASVQPVGVTHWALLMVLLSVSGPGPRDELV